MTFPVTKILYMLMVLTLLLFDSVMRLMRLSLSLNTCRYLVTDMNKFHSVKWSVANYASSETDILDIIYSRKKSVPRLAPWLVVNF